MTSPESRTYVTTTSNRWMVAFLSDIAATLRQAKIHCLKRLLHTKLTKSQINSELQQQFKINKRQANSIIACIEGQVRSARKCRSNHLQQLQGKYKHLTQVITNLEKKIDAHRKYLRTKEEVGQGKKKTIPKTFKPKYEDACPVRCSHHLTHSQFAQVKLHNKKRYAHKKKRQIEHIKSSPLHVNLGNQYAVEMIGSKDESYGNQIAQLDLLAKELHIRVPYFLEVRYGKYLSVPIVLPKHGQDNLATAWFNKQAITYRFIQKSWREWEIHITLDVLPVPKQTSDARWGAIGVDLNPGSIGWAKTDKDGNLEGFAQIKTNIQSQACDRTEAILVDTVTQLTELALKHNCPLVVEKLDFSQKIHRLRELSSRHNRMLSNFAYSKFLQLLKARCFKLGIEIIEINPAYSSLIGLVKFMSMYGMNSATAAALVLALDCHVFKRKTPSQNRLSRNGTKKARLVALGVNQQASVGFFPTLVLHA